MDCAAILVYVHVILFKKHTEFNFCQFFKILSSYDTCVWQYEVWSLSGRWRFYLWSCGLQCRMIWKVDTKFSVAHVAAFFCDNVSSIYPRNAGKIAPDYAVS